MNDLQKGDPLRICPIVSLIWTLVRCALKHLWPLPWPELLDIVHVQVSTRQAKRSWSVSLTGYSNATFYVDGR